MDARNAKEEATPAVKRRPDRYFEEKLEPLHKETKETIRLLQEAEERIHEYYDDRLWSIENCPLRGNVGFDVQIVSLRVETLRHIVSDLQILTKHLQDEVLRVYVFCSASAEYQNAVLNRKVTAAQAYRETLYGKPLTKLQEDFRHTRIFYSGDSVARELFVKKCQELDKASNYPSVAKEYLVHLDDQGRPRPFLHNFPEKYPLKPLLELNVALDYLWELSYRLFCGAQILSGYCSSLVKGHVPLTPHSSMTNSAKNKKAKREKGKQDRLQREKLVPHNLLDTLDEMADGTEKTAEEIARDAGLSKEFHEKLAAAAEKKAKAALDNGNFEIDEDSQRRYYWGHDKTKVFIDDFDEDCLLEGEEDPVETASATIQELLPAKEREKLDLLLVPFFEANAHAHSALQLAVQTSESIKSTPGTSATGWPAGQKDITPEMIIEYQHLLNQNCPTKLRSIMNCALTVLQGWASNTSDVTLVEKYFKLKAKLGKMMARICEVIITMGNLSVLDAELDLRQSLATDSEKLIEQRVKVLIKFPDLPANLKPGYQPTRKDMIRPSEEKIRKKHQEERNIIQRRLKKIYHTQDRLPPILPSLLTSIFADKSRDPTFAPPPESDTGTPHTSTPRASAKKKPQGDTRRNYGNEGRGATAQGGAGGDDGQDGDDDPSKNKKPTDFEEEDSSHEEETHSDTSEEDRREKNKKSEEKKKEGKKKPKQAKDKGKGKGKKSSVQKTKKEVEDEKATGRQDAIRHARRMRGDPGDPSSSPSSSSSSSSLHSSLSGSSEFSMPERGRKRQSKKTPRGDREMLDRMKADRNLPYMRSNYLKVGIASQDSDPWDSVPEYSRKRADKSPTESEKKWRAHTAKQKKDLVRSRLIAAEKVRQREQRMKADNIYQLVDNLSRMNLSETQIVQNVGIALAQQAGTGDSRGGRFSSFSGGDRPTGSKDIKPCNALPPFDGADGTLAVKTFLKEVDLLKRNRDWDDLHTAEQVRLKLEGKAKVWFRNNLDKGWIHRYSALRPEIEKRFYAPVVLSEKLQVQKSLQFDPRRHGSHMDFFDEVQSKQDVLFDSGQIDIDWSVSHTLAECRDQKFLELFLLGAAPFLRQKIYESKEEKLKPCLEIARNYEAALRARDFRDRKKPGGSHEINSMEASAERGIDADLMEQYGYTESDVMALQKDNPVVCFYCGEQNGHFKRQCPKLAQDSAAGNVGPDKAGRYAGQPPKTLPTAAMTGPPRITPFPRRTFVRRRGRGGTAPTARRGWRPSGGAPAAGRGRFPRRRFVRGGGRGGPRHINALQEAPMPEMEEEYYENPEGYYEEEVYYEEDEEGNLYVYDEEYPDYTDQAEKPDHQDIPKESSAVGAVEISKSPRDTTAEELGKSCGQGAQLFHLI